jgi:TatD DNase family protein
MPDYSDLAEVLERASAAKVEAFIDVGFDLESSKRSVGLSSSIDNVFSAVGIHPHDAQLVDVKSLAELTEMAKRPKVVAIGETGLDYYRNLSPKESQIDAFRKHIELAIKSNLPLIVHARDSYDDTLRILHEEGVGKLAGVMHCFSGDKRAVELTLDLGFYISFAGPVTFKNAHALREIVKTVPVERMLIETDCPYLAPDPKRGTRNEPSYIIYTAQKLAELKGLNLEEFAAKVKNNALELFTKLKI